MVCALLKRGIVGLIFRSVLRFFDRAMGCFFTCFRIREDRSNRSRPHLISSNFAPSKPTLEAGASKNRLSSLFLSEEKEGSPCDDIENLYSRSSRFNKELRDEAKFLKACGTLPETPNEIRKGCEKRVGSPPLDKDSEPSRFHSWLPNTSIKKLQLDEPSDQLPSPNDLCEDWGRGSVSLEQTPSSCISNAHTIGNSKSGSPKTMIKARAYERDDVASVSPLLSAMNVQHRNKSVHFECDFDTSSSRGSSSENSCQVLRKLESPGNLTVPKPSPKPTPLKLSDEMQTPGTVFPANLEILANGRTRIRSQYVYSVLNPVENDSQWKALKEDDFNSLQLSAELRDSLEQSESATRKLELGVKETSTVKDLNVDMSMSSLVKPPLSTLGDHKTNVGTACSRNFGFGGTPGDRPILGMVAAHWNENETAQISPKWWDGNGIPNSTNKYKEDQKVSWHATPFEERLEKALSEENFISQRKHINGRPIVFEECEESDTALSQLQASTQAKPVISF